jgi:hypothetical protein
MDMETDMDRMYLAIDKLYPLWRFSLAEKKVQELTRSTDARQPFGLMWLAQF